jgi:phytoene/squalene synthetase
MSDFIAGCVADAATMRYATWNALRRHCEAIAGSAAAMIVAVLGAQHSDARRHAIDLGAALRLVSILQSLPGDRDPTSLTPAPGTPGEGRGGGCGGVRSSAAEENPHPALPRSTGGRKERNVAGSAAGGKEEAARRYVYLPLEDLARCRYSERELLDGVASARFDELIALQTARTRSMLDESIDQLCWLAGDGSRIAVATLIEHMRTTILRIERGEFISHRPSLGRMIRLLPRAAKLARRDGAPR